jgi:hypothetical protein
MRLIAFAGPARAGKSACATILEENAKQKYRVVRESFAKPMREAWERLAVYLTNKTGELVSRETRPNLYRETMQRWGEKRRKRDQDHWVNRLTERLFVEKVIEKAQYEREPDFQETLVIIDDMRYENELCLISSLGGVSVFVDPGNRIQLDQEFRKHESEAMAMAHLKGEGSDDAFDYRISNTRSTNRLVAKVVGQMDQWLWEADV